MVIINYIILVLIILFNRKVIIEVVNFFKMKQKETILYNFNLII
jgi:hypothetical protein